MRLENSGWNGCVGRGRVIAPPRQTDAACNACPSGDAACQGVQRCPDNTRIRTDASGAGSAACPAASGVGMVYAVRQALADVYQSESALRAGTLFPQLHKPLNGFCPPSSNGSTRGQQSAFAAWDLRLYLDTHPDDAQALALFAQLAQEAQSPSYATAFLPGGTAWFWTDDPWPWECRANGGQ